MEVGDSNSNGIGAIARQKMKLYVKEYKLVDDAPVEFGLREFIGMKELAVIEVIYPGMKVYYEGRTYVPEVIFDVDMKEHYMIIDPTKRFNTASI